jgi:ABC-type dipeptide/oligopeptide/nickel transport system permease component
MMACTALPSCLLATQAHSAMRQELAAPYADTLRVYCATDIALRLKMMPSVLVKLTPSLETALSLTLASMLFAEPILGQAGIGTLTARAVRRSDLDLLLGAVLLCACLIALARLVGWALRRHYRLPL